MWKKFSSYIFLANTRATIITTHKSILQPFKISHPLSFFLQPIYNPLLVLSCKSPLIHNNILLSSMSQLNLFHKFTEEQQFRSHLTLTTSLSAILDFCEYSIHIEFNERDKQKYKKKNRKKEISQDFLNAFNALNREEKVEYYLRVVNYLRNFVKNCFDPPSSPFSGVINDTGYCRSYNVKRWKEKKLRMDQDRHIVLAERQAKIKTYDMKDYLLRLSRNKDYYTIVLEAINNNPAEKSRTVHIGFTDKNVFEKWYRSIKFSVQFREWELFRYLYCGSVQKILEKIDNRTNSYFSEGVKETLNIIEGGKVMDISISDKLSKSVIVESKQEQKKPLGHHSSRKKEETHLKELEKEIKSYQQKLGNTNHPKTIVDELIDGQIFEQPDVFEDKIEQQDEKSKSGKRHLDLFHKMHPEYELEQLEIYLNYAVIHQQESLKIYQNELLQKRLKIVLTFPKEKYTPEGILSLISKGQTLKQLNDNIQEIQIKTNIPSQNSALLYMVLKPFNRLYRSRDFIFIRHVFKSGKQVYMIDKSIENTNYPPFMTIVRGQLCVVYGIFERDKTYEMIADVEISNEGLLNIAQEASLTLKYLKAFSKVTKAEVEENSYKLFDLSWDITKNEVNQIENEIRVRRNTIKEINKKISYEQEKEKEKNEPIAHNFSKKNSSYTERELSKVEEQQENSPKDHKSSSLSPPPSHKSPKEWQLKVQSPYYSTKPSQEEMPELSLEQSNPQSHFKTQTAIIRKLNEQGYVILDPSYLKHRYLLKALEKEQVVMKRLNADEGHPIWKNQWIHDDKEGGIIFIHKKKIQDQKGVLKFILSKMAKNLVSGQSVLSISLPVDIFSAQSNLQRFLYSMAYAPLILQKLQKETPINKLVKTVIFGVTNSVLYLSMEKPFNPILGETFQCWINGCPAYAQQISHHPPIGALMFKGRNFDVTAQIESKVSLGVNSGTGTNQGIYRVAFADKTEVCFMTPGGEVSGLSHGDRKFNLVGKSYYWITNTNIMLELAFDPFKKGFFSVGKQQKPSDYFQGTIWEVKPQFMKKFMNGKRKQPEQKDRVRQYGRITGVWNRYITFKNEEIFNFERELPIALEYEPFPLPSDSNWREDIEYRRRNMVTRAQTEKERLQVLQRKDRKLRQKMHKKK